MEGANVLKFSTALSEVWFSRLLTAIITKIHRENFKANKVAHFGRSSRLHGGEAHPCFVDYEATLNLTPDAKQKLVPRMRHIATGLLAAGELLARSKNTQKF